MYSVARRAVVAALVVVDVLRNLDTNSNANDDENDESEEEAYPALLTVSPRADLGGVEVDTTKNTLLASA